MRPLRRVPSPAAAAIGISSVLAKTPQPPAAQRQPGEELGYEYGLTWESTDDPKELANYACRCGAAACRGTMLDAVPLGEIIVVAASAEEAAQHEEVLAGLDKGVKGQCVWRNYSLQG